MRHREYIQDIDGSIAFAIQSFPVNPGMAATFPWLSGHAQLYETYKFHKLSFEYESQKTVTDGVCLIAIDFDSADAAPANKQQLSSFEGAARAKVWQEFAYHAKPSSLHKIGPVKYNRYGVLAANLDIKTYDAGNAYVATQGCDDASAIGELWVDYDVEFSTPQINPNGATGGTFTSTTGVATGSLLGTLNAGTIAGTMISSVSASQVVLQNLTVGQEYLILFDWECTSSTTLPALTVTGLTLKSSFLNPSAQSTHASAAATYTATATSGTVTPSAITLTAATEVDFVIAPIPISAF